MVFQDYRGTRGNQGWMDCQERWAKKEFRGPQEYRATWGSQGSMDSLV